MAESSCGLCRVEKALCECECTGLQLCAACILPHISTSGNHTMKPIPQLPQSLTTPSVPAPQIVHETCSLCLGASPEHVCACESTGVVLCAQCISLHTSKISEKEHTILPLKARSFVGRPGYVERLKLRQNSMKESIANMKKSISLVQSCKSQLQNRVENLILSVTTYRNTNTENLTKYEDFLQQSLELVNTQITDNIYDEDYTPLSPYATAIWTSNLNQEDLFVYKKSGQYKVKMAMRLNRDFTFKSYGFGNIYKDRKPRIPVSIMNIPTIPAKSANSSVSLDPANYLAQVSDQHIYLYDCSTGGYLIKFAVPPEITTMSSVLMLPSGSAFISGGAAPVSPFACEICPKTGLVSQLQNMLVPRYGHGTIYNCGCVYVFGGTSLQGRIGNCEALEMENKQWRPLASLQQARDFFNPCLYESSVFILGGRKTTLCEQYSIPENTFTLLPFQVPEGGQCTSLLISKSIVYLHKRQIIKFSLESMRLEWETVMLAPSVGWSVLNPVLVGNTMYFVKSITNGLRKLELPAEALNSWH